MSDDRLKIVFGFFVLTILSVLAVICLVRHYDQADDIIGALSFAAGGFVQWAFSSKNGGHGDRT